MTIRIDDTGDMIFELPGYGMLCGAGTTVPSSSTEWAHGAWYLDIDGSSSLDSFYINVAATGATCDFRSVVPGVGTATGVSANHLTLNGTSDVIVQLNSIGVLQIDDAVISAGFKAAADTPGQNVWVQAQSGGTASSAGPGQVGANLNLASGYSSDAFTGSDGDAANGTSVIVSARSASLLDGLGSAKINGSIVLNSPNGIFVTQGAPDTSSASNPGVTAAHIAAGIFIVSGQTSAQSCQLDTGANMDAAFKIADVGTGVAIDWTLDNTNTSSGAVTVTAGTSGHTVAGNMTIPIATTGRFRSRRTATNTWITNRLS